MNGGGRAASNRAPPAVADRAAVLTPGAKRGMHTAMTRRHRQRLVAAAAMVAGVWTAPAAAAPAAKPKPGATVGVRLVHTVKPPSGFVDDPIAFDGAGSRLAYVHSDSAALCQLEVLDIAQGFASIASIDLAKVTTAPSDLAFTAGADRVFVTYRVGASEDGAGKAAVLVDVSTGKIVRRFGPADDVRLGRYDGEPVVVAYDATRKRDRKGRVWVTHRVDVRRLDTGKRVGKPLSLVADDTGYIEKLDFRLQYWLDDYLTAVGVKGGTWDRVEDQRSPDVAARYDVVQRLFVRKDPIADLTEFAREVQVRREHANEASFLRVAHDLSGLYWHRDGERAVPIALAQPFHHYDPKSLLYQRAADGGMFFSLEIDPVNPDAVARKKADPKWLDLYRLAPGAAKAERVGRVLLGQRKIAWRASDRHWALLEKHIGFSRGGPVLRVYAVR